MKNPPDDSETLVGEESKPAGISTLQPKLERYAKAHRRSRDMAAFLRTAAGCKNVDVSSTKCAHSAAELQLAARCAEKLSCCGEWLHFRHYFRCDELRLVAAQFCHLSKLCPLCAIRRGARNLGAYLERFRQLVAERPELVAYMVTLTVKNGPDLVERMSHLRGAVKRLVDRRRQAISGNGRGRTEFRKVVGAVGSFEVTNKGNGWHPHVHMIALCSEPLQVDALKTEWQRSTGDSFIVDVRPLVFGADGPGEAFCEVFKYAMKFQDMNLADNWRAHLELRGLRLLVSIGCFRDVVEPQLLTDVPLENEPYVDMFFRYLARSGAYTYDRRSESSPASIAAEGPQLPVPPPLIRKQSSHAEIVEVARAAREAFQLAADEAPASQNAKHAMAGAGGKP